MKPALDIDRPWLRLDLGTPHRVCSWAVNRPGLVNASAISWREVRNADLTKDFAVEQWLNGALTTKGWQDDVALLTSRDVRAAETASETVDGVSVQVVATVGLSNAEAVGARMDRTGHDWGTINVALVTDAALSDPALIELMSIVAQARTVAVAAVDYVLPTGRAAGTGTDCIAVAAPQGDTRYAGMHTGLGAAAGRAVHDAVLAGARIWMDTVRRDA